MPIPFLLAHGALGGVDEVIFVSVAAIFIVMMGISWVRSRNLDLDLEDTPEQSDEPDMQADSPDHIALD